MVQAGLSHSKTWEELVSGKNSAAAALRFDTGSMLEQNNSLSADAWISQASQRDMQSLTMALQRELCSQSTKSNANIYEFQSLPGSSAWTGSEWRCKSESEVSSESGAKGDEGEGGGLGIESLVSQQSQFKRNNGLSATGKVSKRRSRAANKTPITFLNADPANFRAMVQQVTGVPINPNATRLWSSSTAGVGMPGLVRPEPKRASSSTAAVTATASAAIQGLPTLDTSAIFIAACGGAPANLNNAFTQPPPLVRSTAPAEDLFISEKLRAACMQSFLKNGGGSGGGGGSGSGYFVPDQNQGFLNSIQEPDWWFNNNVDELSGSVL